MVPKIYIHIIHRMIVYNVSSRIIIFVIYTHGSVKKQNTFYKTTSHLELCAIFQNNNYSCMQLSNLKHQVFLNLNYKLCVLFMSG